MKLRSELGSGVGSVDAVRSLVGGIRPISIREILNRYRSPIVIDEPLITPDGIALGGHHTITLERDGRFQHVGHMRATGFPSFTYGVRTVLVNDAGVPAVAAATGGVHGSNSFGDRESNWDQQGLQPLVAWHWASMKRARPETSINREADFFGSFGDVLDFLGPLVGGAIVGGPVGVCVMLGINAADAAGLDQQAGVGGLVGVASAGAVLLVFGPSAIVPAVVVGAAAGVAVDLLLKHRRMSAAEIAFAERVFGRTLPVDRIVLTNMLGLGGRPFTIPSVGDTILVNLGEGFDNPVSYSGFGSSNNPNRQAPGQLFIHELVHAWQIDTATFLPGLICAGVSTQLSTLGGDMSVYRYGAADINFSEFNPEQQGSIVDDWFAGSGKQKPFGAQLGDDRNPYFRYIRDNLRNRIP